MKYISALSKDWATKEKQALRRIEKKCEFATFMQSNGYDKEPIYLTDLELRVVSWALSAYRNEIAHTDYVGRSLNENEINSNLELEKHFKK